MLKKSIWSPYLAGAFIGLLLASLFALGERFGTSTGVAKLGALLEWSIAPAHAESAPQFMEVCKDKTIFDWTLLFISGIFIGSFLASKLSGVNQAPRDLIWQERFGKNKWKRGLAAAIGGALLMFGARLADGCTSGHAITGGAQFSISSFVFMFALFGVGIPFSFYLYRRQA